MLRYGWKEQMLSNQTERRFRNEQKQTKGSQGEAQTNFARNKKAMRETWVVSLDILSNPLLSPDFLVLNSNVFLHF